MSRWRVGPLSVLLAGLLASCDMVQQVTGADPVPTVVRDNPLDSGSTRPLIIDVSGQGPDVVETLFPSFQLSFPEGVASYRLQIASTQEFQAPVFDRSGIVPGSFRIPTTLANHGQYFWRVQPALSDGRMGEWSQSRTFSILLPVPGLLSPTQGASINTPFPTLSWQGIQGVSAYDLRWGPTGGIPGDATVVHLSGTSQRLDTGVADGANVSWQVRAWIDDVAGDWSTVSSLNISLPVPQTGSPGNGQSTHDSRFSWSAAYYLNSNGTVGYTTIPDITGFQMVLSTTSDFSSPLLVDKEVPFASPGDSVCITPDDALTLGSTYFWRIRSLYPHGIRGPWSSVSSFVRDRISSVMVTEADSIQTLFLTDDAYLCFDYGRLVKIDPQGKRLWSLPVLSGTSISIGNDGVIYVVDVQGALTALNPDGSTRWVHVWPNSGTASQLAISSEGTLRVLVTYPIDYTHGTTSRCALWALDHEGTSLWQFPMETSVWVSGDSQLVGGGDGISYIAKYGVLHAISKTGSSLWNLDVSGSFSLLVTVSRYGKIVLCDYKGYNLALVDSNGTIQWTKFGSYSPPAIDREGTLYLNGSDSDTEGLHAYGEDGTTKWTLPIQHSSWVADPKIGKDGILYCSQNTGRVFAISMADGSVVWESLLIINQYGFTGTLLDGAGNLLAWYPPNGLIAIIPTTSQGIDTGAPWPMRNHDPRGTRFSATP